MADHKELDVWKKSMRLSVDIYRATESFPKSEIYGLTSQLRRAAVSIPANIAEGSGRGHTKEYTQFLHVAIGSANEVETFLLLAKSLGHLKPETADALLTDLTAVLQLLWGTLRSVKRRSPSRE